MIKFKTGNILTEDAEAIVNTVNCVGVMGRGLALQFKNAFPDNFKAYAAACKREEVQPGNMFVYETGGLTNLLRSNPRPKRSPDPLNIGNHQSGRAEMLPSTRKVCPWFSGAFASWVVLLTKIEFRHDIKHQMMYYLMLIMLK